MKKTIIKSKEFLEGVLETSLEFYEEHSGRVEGLQVDVTEVDKVFKAHVYAPVNTIWTTNGDERYAESDELAENTMTIYPHEKLDSVIADFSSIVSEIHSAVLYYK